MNRKKKVGFGPHLMLDCYECNKEKLTNFHLLYEFLNNLPSEINMTKMTLPYCAKWKDKFASVEGVSAFVMIAESHISLHTFPEQGYAFMDIFSCREFDVEKARKLVLEFFEAKKSDNYVVNRGKTFLR